MAFHFQDRRRSYLEPIEPLLYAVWALRVCLINALRSGDYGILVQYKRLRDLAFVLWFQTLNEYFLRFESRTAIPDLVAAAHGTVLDLGPGLGNQFTRFDQHRVEHIFGIEPNAAFRPALQTQIAKSNWTDRYTLITAGVEESDVLEQHGILPESLDVVVSIQVLCSVAQPEAVVKDLYRRLKPGGKLIFWEHHASHDWMTRIIQGLWNLIWPIAIGGCNMNRDITAILLGAGEWEGFGSIQGDEKPWSMLPRVWGELVKPARS